MRIGIFPTAGFGRDLIKSDRPLLADCVEKVAALKLSGN